MEEGLSNTVYRDEEEGRGELPSSGLNGIVDCRTYRRVIEALRAARSLSEIERDLHGEARNKNAREAGNCLTMRVNTGRIALVPR